MDRLTDTFSAQHIVLPVIHLASTDQALRQAETALTAGAPGVFLVNHDSGWKSLIDAANAVRERTGLWVGANALDLTASQVFTELCQNVELDGVWTDNARIDERLERQTLAEEVDVARQGFEGLYFGGVAFKYQREVQDLATAARIAARHMDVVTTSGPATAHAADPTKIEAITAAARFTPTAVASGVSEENVASLIQAGARAFIVASSISTDWTTFDPVRTRALVTRVTELSTAPASRSIQPTRVR
jgi:2-keto-3-deoxy-6-phosphogluconate aldolase